MECIIPLWPKKKFIALGTNLLPPTLDELKSISGITEKKHTKGIKNIGLNSMNFKANKAKRKPNAKWVLNIIFQFLLLILLVWPLLNY